MKLVTNLGEIRDHYGSPLDGQWRKLLIVLREDARFFNRSREVSLRFILDNNGIYDALWAARCFPELYTLIKLYSLWCAERVRHLMTDARSTDALNLARRYLNSKSTLKEYLRYALKIAAEHAKEAAIKRKKEADLFASFDDRPDAIAKRATANAARSAWLVAISAAAAYDEWDHVCHANYEYFTNGLYASGDTLYDAVYSAVSAADSSLFRLTTEEEKRANVKALTKEFLRLIECYENGVEYKI